MKTILGWLFTVLKFLKSRVFAAGILAMLLSVTVYAATTTINTVYIHKEDETILLRTAEDDIDKILANEGIIIDPTDLVEFTGFHENTAEVYIKNTFKVHITADGETKTVTMVNGTVRDAMELAGVTMDDDDLINLTTGTFVSANDEIIINRVAYRNTEVEEDIPFEKVDKLTPLLRNGKSEILQSGRPGTLVKTYTERTIDGVVEESTLIAENITVRPVTQVALVGAEVPVSDLDFGYEIVNHVPSHYQKVITTARATGYSAGNGAWGASGNHLFYGHVAVNPNVIPYNSKLYITSPDGKFVYGYAIASDTGVALMQGVIDIDLYYETYRESQLNGVKWVNIYVLE